MQTLFFLIFILGCSDKNLNLEEPINEKDLKLVWQKSLDIGNKYTITSTPIISKKSIAFFYDIIETKEKILLVNKQDTSDARIFGQNSGDYKERKYVPDYGYILMDAHNLFLLENEQLTNIWTVPANLNYHFDMSIINDDVYLNTATLDKKNSLIYKINLQNYNYSIHFQVKGVEENDTLLKVEITPPFTFSKSESENILLYRTFRLSVNNEYAKYSTEAFSKDMKNKIWKRNLSIGSNINLVNYNFKIIYCSADSIYSLEPINGRSIWSLAPIHNGKPDSWAIRGCHLLDDKLYFIDQGHFVEINPMNGKVLYDSPELFSAQSNSEMTYFEGIFYWSCLDDGYSWIYGYRPDDHKLVLKMKSPNTGKAPFFNDTNFYLNGLQIDPETRLGYTADGFFAMCFKIPESYE